jgi:hypothetical protein
MRIEYENERMPMLRPIMEDEEELIVIEDIQAILIEIAQNLGYDYIELSENKLGAGFIDITNDVSIIIKYNREKIISLKVQVGDFNKNKFDCTTNSSTIDEISVALQTASMICAEIRRKIR